MNTKCRVAFLLPYVVGTFIAFSSLQACSYVLKSAADREAETENQRFWANLYVKCGESYYGDVAPGQSEMRGVSFSVSPARMTELDKENGYEWKGQGVLRFSRRRILSFGKWGDWMSSAEDWMTGGSLTASLQKKAGAWSGVYSPFDRNIVNNRPSCERMAALHE